MVSRVSLSNLRQISERLLEIALRFIIAHDIIDIAERFLHELHGCIGFVDDFGNLIFVRTEDVVHAFGKFADFIAGAGERVGRAAEVAFDVGERLQRIDGDAAGKQIAPFRCGRARPS